MCLLYPLLSKCVRRLMILRLSIHSHISIVCIHVYLFNWSRPREMKAGVQCQPRVGPDFQRLVLTRRIVCFLSFDGCEIAKIKSNNLFCPRGTASSHPRIGPAQSLSKHQEQQLVECNFKTLLQVQLVQTVV